MMRGEILRPSHKSWMILGELQKKEIQSSPWKTFRLESVTASGTSRARSS